MLAEAPADRAQKKRRDDGAVHIEHLAFPVDSQARARIVHVGVAHAGKRAPSRFYRAASLAEVRITPDSTKNCIS